MRGDCGRDVIGGVIGRRSRVANGMRNFVSIEFLVMCANDVGVGVLFHMLHVSFVFLCWPCILVLVKSGLLLHPLSACWHVGCGRVVVESWSVWVTGTIARVG